MIESLKRSNCAPRRWEPVSTYALRKRAEKEVMQAENFERGQLDQLFNVAYEELRRLASAVKRADGSVTLNPTALVNEAWLKLAASAPFAAQSKLHFKRIAARAMRQVLVEAARRRNARKRGGDQGQDLITFHDSIAPVSSEAQMLSLDHALDELARARPRQATIVEGRFFGGLDIAEIAQLLEISEATVVRDWRAAKAWLAKELSGELRG